MATRTIKIDDLDGKSEGAETTVFGANGSYYEIDLAAANVKKLEDAIAPFVDKARQISARDALKNGNGAGEFDPAIVRAWAQRNGKQINDKGRVPQEIVDEWRKATNQQ